MYKLFMRLSYHCMLLTAVAVLISTLTSARAQTPVIGFESGPMAVVGTPANSSHAAGTAVGPSGILNPGTNSALLNTNQSGLFVVPVARVANGALIVTQFAMTSSGGSTGQYVVRIWSRLPGSTTCIDNTAFAGNFTADDQYLITPPFSITPAAPASVTGDTATYASLTTQTFAVQTTDMPSSRNVYVCLVTVATDTADENKGIRVMISGPQD